MTGIYTTMKPKKYSLHCELPTGSRLLEGTNKHCSKPKPAVNVHTKAAAGKSYIRTFHQSKTKQNTSLITPRSVKKSIQLRRLPRHHGEVMIACPRSLQTGARLCGPATPDARLLCRPAVIRVRAVEAGAAARSGRGAACWDLLSQFIGTGGVVMCFMMDSRGMIRSTSSGNEIQALVVVVVVGIIGIALLDAGLARVGHGGCVEERTDGLGAPFLR